MDITVQHVEMSVRGNGDPIYVATVDAVLDDGTEDTAVHIIPTDIFETRAAEYDIDPVAEGGWGQLLEIVFRSPYLYLQAVDELADPEHLFNAPTVAAARKGLLKKLDKARDGKRILGASGESPYGTLGEATLVRNSGIEDPLEFVKRTAPMSTPHIRVKQEFTRRRRNLMRARRAGRHPMQLSDLDSVDQQVKRDMTIPARESADKLAERLLGGTPDTATVKSRLPPREGPLSKDLEPDLHDLNDLEAP